MPRQSYRGVMVDMPTKIRKRGCSSSSSTSSRIHNYRLSKRAILVGKSRAGLRGSRSSTPVPTWRTTPMRSVIESPKYSQSGKSTQPVSARRLAATLWEMNEIPFSPSNLQQQQKKSGSKMASKKQPGWGLDSGLGQHLLDSTHSPSLSEKMDQSVSSSFRRRIPIPQRIQSANQHDENFDSISNASFMEIESRSRPEASSASATRGGNRLKDVSNALTTSKELLKIINRIWARADPPSSSLSLISALHAELERARLQVNQLIQEQRSDKNDINYLMKCFAEERALWKNKEKQAIETAIVSITGELEVERKLRRQLESLNKKLGKELAEMKSSFFKAVKELESEKRAREITEQVCDELARNINEDRAEVEKKKSESVKVHEDVEKEREMLELADKLREERVQTTLSESRHQFEEKNSAIGKLRKQLEVFLGTKKDKEEKRATYKGKSNFSSHRNDQDNEDGEVEDPINEKEDSVESDLRSIELNLDNKHFNEAYELKARNLISEKASRRSTSIQRSASEGVEWSIQAEKEAQRMSVDEMQRRKHYGKGLKNNVLSSSRLSLAGDYHSPSRQRNDAWLLGDSSGIGQVTDTKARIANIRGEVQSSRRSKW